MPFCARKDKMAALAILKRLERKVDVLIKSHADLTEEVQELANRVNEFGLDICEISDEEEEEEEEEEAEETDENDEDEEDRSAVKEMMKVMFPKEIPSTSSATSNSPPTPPSSSNHVWNIRSHTDRKKTYAVELSDGTKWVCNCPAFIYRKSDNYICKHIKQVQEDEF